MKCSRFLSLLFDFVTHEGFATTMAGFTQNRLLLSTNSDIRML